MLNIAINGLGRIGRATLKIVLDNPALRFTAVNDVLPADKFPVEANEINTIHAISGR